MPYGVLFKMINSVGMRDDLRDVMGYFEGYVPPVRVYKQWSFVRIPKESKPSIKD